MPLFLRPSYCFLFFTFALLLGTASPFLSPDVSYPEKMPANRRA
jgi:hypothetical protein